MLKKRILAFQAAIMLSASMMASVIAPIGNIAIVHAAEPAKKPITWNYIESEIGSNYKYHPGQIEAKYSGKNNRVVTGDKIKLSVRNAKTPTTNFKDKIYYYKEDFTRVYGVRTVNEAAAYKGQDFAISSVTDEYGVPVDAAKFAEYVTVDPSGYVSVVGKGKFRFSVEKRFEGTSEWTVVDTYEDGITDTQKIKRMKDEEVYNPDTHAWEFVENNDGYTLTKNFTVNYEDSTGTNYRYSEGYGTKTSKEAFPTNTSFSIYGTYGYWHYEDVYDENDDYVETIRVYDYDEFTDEISAGESSVIPLNAYKPLNESSKYQDDGDTQLSYNKYDSATDTYSKVGAVRTIKETVSGQPKVEWTISSVEYKDDKGIINNTTDAATIAKYAEIKNGVLYGKEACKAFVTVSCTVTSKFDAKNIWDDGKKEEYTFNQGYNEGKDINNTVTYTRKAEITVINPSDDYDAFYARALRLDDINESFGSFNSKAKDIKLGKGETKSVADAWGSYEPKNDFNLGTYKTEYVYYDANGKRQVKRAQYTLKENVKSITHEYSSSDETKAKVDEQGKVTGKETGLVTIEDKATIRSTFTATFTWDDGKVQSIETGEQIGTKTNKIKVEIVNADKANQNFDVVTVGTGKYTICTDTKTAIFKAPTKKTAKNYTIPAKIKVNGMNFKVVGIDNNALKGYKKLQKLTVKATINTLGTGVLSGCTGLTTADFTNVKLSIFPAGTFTKCNKLKKLTINGNSLMYVDDEAYKGLPKGTVITIKAKNKSTYNAVVQEFKDAGYTNFTFKYKKFKK